MNFHFENKLGKNCNLHISYLSTWEKFASPHTIHDLWQNHLSDQVWVQLPKSGCNIS